MTVGCRKQTCHLHDKGIAARLRSFCGCAAFTLACSFLLCVGKGQDNSSAGVTYERIVNAPFEANNWLTYSGSYSGWRYSNLAEITKSNSGRLRLEGAVHT